MDQGTLVANRIDDGRRFVERFAADGHPVQAAFWAKTDEESSLFLYVATELVDREGPAVAYRAVHASLGKLGESSVSSSEIKIVSPSRPLAQAILAVMSRLPGRLVTRFGGEALGLMSIDQVHIYPSHAFSFTQPNPMTTEDVGREILRLMNRGPGTPQPSRVTLKDGTGFNGVPFSIQFGSEKALVVQFVVDREATPRVVRLDEIASIA